MQRRVAAVVVAALAMAACGDNDLGFEVFDVYVYAQPSLVQYRVGDAAWHAPRLIASDQGWQTYALDVVEDYELEVVCSVGLITYDVQLDATIEDGEQDLQPGPGDYCGTPAPTVTTFEVSGTYTNASAYVTIGGYRDTNPNEPQNYFAIQAPQGTDDLIANDGTNVEIVRGLAVNAPMTLPELDLEDDGAPFDLVTLDIQGAKPTGVGDIATGESWLDTDYGAMIFSAYVPAPGQTTGTFAIAPASQRHADDVSEVVWAGVGANSSAWVSIDGNASPGETPIAIVLPSVDGVAAEVGADNVVTWSALTNEDYNTLQFSTGCVSPARSIKATRRFLDLGNSVAFTSSTPVPFGAIQLIEQTSRSYDGYTTWAGAWTMPTPCTSTPSP
jgi:hypothetical protein